MATKAKKVSSYAAKQVARRQAGWDAHKAGTPVHQFPPGSSERFKMDYEAGWRSAKAGMARPELPREAA